MKVELLHTWPLLGLLALGLIGWWHRGTLARLSPGRQRWSVGLRATLLLLLVLALCEPQWIARSSRHAVVWLVDASRSMGGEALTAAKAFAEKLAEQPDAERWVAFAGQPLDWQPDHDLPTPEMLDDRATNLAAALHFAEATFPPGYTRTAVVFSDGRETRGDVAASLARLRESGVRVMTVPVNPPDRPEMLVRRVDAPRRANRDEPFKVSVEVTSNHATRARLGFFRNGTLLDGNAEPVTLRKGVNRFEITQRIGDERVTDFSAAITPLQESDDTVMDNNRATAFVLGGGEPKVLIVSDKPEQARYLGRALKQEGIALHERPAMGAPAELADLQNYDLLILDNIPATDLTSGQMALYASYVRDFGGGLLMLGGDQSFGLGGYYQTAVEEVLPVRCDFEKEEETPSLGMVLILDRSGSMGVDKMEMAKDAAKAAVELLSPRDSIGVVAFDNEAAWVAEVQSAAGKAGVIQQIATIQASGGTNMAPAMEIGLRQLTAAPSKIKHMIILSDGMSTEGPFYELATQAAAQGITLSTVGLGSDADRELLGRIAEWGNGRFYFTDDPGNVPQIFTKETMTASKSALHEEPFLAVPSAPSDFLGGIAFNEAPFLLGYVTTKLKPTAECWLVTERSEPLLATWRVGLGQVGAFTSDARNRWAVEWLRWEGYGRFWAQLTRKLMRQEAMKHFPVEVTPRGEEFHFALDTPDAAGRPQSGLTAELRIRNGEETTSLPLANTGPGRYELRSRLSRDGSGADLTLIVRQGEEVVDHQSLVLAKSYPDEFLLQPLDEGLLRRIASDTGGVYAPEPDALADSRTAPAERELWPWLVGLAMLLFLADVAVRRWPASSLSPRSPFSL